MFRSSLLSFVYGCWPFDGWVLPFGRSMARWNDGWMVIEVFSLFSNVSMMIRSDLVGIQI